MSAVDNLALSVAWRRGARRGGDGVLHPHAARAGVRLGSCHSRRRADAAAIRIDDCSGRKSRLHTYCLQCRFWCRRSGPACHRCDRQNYLVDTADVAGFARALPHGRLAEFTGRHNPYFFSPSGTKIVYREPGSPETGQDIGIGALEEGAEPDGLLNGPFNELNAELSPEGGAGWRTRRMNRGGMRFTCGRFQTSVTISFKYRTRVGRGRLSPDAYVSIF